MKRKVSIEEIRRFFALANAQFEESGISLDEVRFIRDSCTLKAIEIDYTVTNTEEDG